MSGPVERIENTLNAYDPMKRTIIVGGAAIFWDLAARGGDTGALELHDVDVVAEETVIASLYDQLPEPHKRNAKAIHGKLTIDKGLRRGNLGLVATSTIDVPRRLHFGEQVVPPVVDDSGLLPFEAFSSWSEYQLPADVDEEASEIIVNEMISPENLAKSRGRRYLKLGQTLWWKMRLGRPTDVKAVQSTLKILNDQKLADNTEFRKILRDMDKEDPFGVRRWW